MKRIFLAILLCLGLAMPAGAVMSMQDIKSMATQIGKSFVDQSFQKVMANSGLTQNPAIAGAIEKIKPLAQTFGNELATKLLQAEPKNWANISKGTAWSDAVRSSMDKAVPTYGSMVYDVLTQKDWKRSLPDLMKNFSGLNLGAGDTNKIQNMTQSHLTVASNLVNQVFGKINTSEVQNAVGQKLKSIGGGLFK